MAAKHAESPKGGQEKFHRLTAVASQIISTEYLPQVGDSRYLSQRAVRDMYPEAFATPTVASLAMAGQQQAERVLANAVGTGATHGAVQHEPAPYQAWDGAYIPDKRNEGRIDASVAQQELQTNYAGWEDLRAQQGNQAPATTQPEQYDRASFIDEVRNDIEHIDQLTADRSASIGEAN